MTILIPDADPDVQEIQVINFWDTQFAKEMYDYHLHPHGWKLDVSNATTVLIPPRNGGWVIRCEKTGSNIFQKGFSNPRYILLHRGTRFLAFQAEVRGWSTVYQLL